MIFVIIWLWVIITHAIQYQKREEQLEKTAYLFFDWYSQEMFQNVGKSSERFFTNEDLFIKKYAESIYSKKPGKVFNYFTKQEIIELYLKHLKDNE